MTVPKSLDTRSLNTCQWCGGVFTASRSHAKFCKPAHRKAYSRWKQKIAYYHGQSERWIAKVLEYLEFPITKQIAARSAVQMINQINTALQNAKVSVIR